MIAIDDSGDRKDGTRTAHVGRQWLGRYGKLMAKAHAAGVTCRAVVADCFYGDHDDLRAEPGAAALPTLKAAILGRRPSRAPLPSLTVKVASSRE